MSKETYQDRYKLFNDFQGKGKQVFEEFKTKDFRHKRLVDIYTLHICPTGRISEKNNYLFEVFYATKPYDEEQSLHSFKCFIEHGTTLEIFRNDNGLVSVLIFQGETEKRKPTVKAFYLKKNIHPKKLKRKSFLKKCWRYFNSCMEVTSLNGKPSLIDKFRYWIVLYNLKCYNDDNGYQPARIWNGAKSIIKYAITVGLSGFLIWLFTIKSQKDNAIKLDDNKQIETISMQLDSLISMQKKIDSSVLQSLAKDKSVIKADTIIPNIKTPSKELKKKRKH